MEKKTLYISAVLLSHSEFLFIILRIQKGANLFHAKFQPSGSHRLGTVCLICGDSFDLSPVVNCYLGEHMLYSYRDSTVFLLCAE